MCDVFARVSVCVRGEAWGRVLVGMFSTTPVTSQLPFFLFLLPAGVLFPRPAFPPMGGGRSYAGNRSVNEVVSSELKERSLGEGGGNFGTRVFMERKSRYRIEDWGRCAASVLKSGVGFRDGPGRWCCGVEYRACKGTQHGYRGRGRINLLSPSAIDNFQNVRLHV